MASCHPPTDLPTGLKGPLVTTSFSCVAESEKHRCIDGGGKCVISTDGYYIVNVLCVMVGLVTFYGYIKPTVKTLQALPIKAWRLGGVVG